MTGFVLTPLAKADLAEIVDYISNESPDAAETVRTKLLDAMQRLAEFPGIGHLREDLTEIPLRFWGVFSYLVIYRLETSPLQILRVLHGARDLKAVLKGI